MRQENLWLLPDGLEEILPPQASGIESLRRQLLDTFASWGYEFIIPPKLEFLDSLTAGLGQNLDLQTFKVTDQLSGRMLGLSADITPQVARIDAHSLKTNQTARYCYCASVAKTQPETQLASRSPIQIGAEIFGAEGLETDLEVVCLMLDSLALAGAQNLTLALGHLGIYRNLLAAANLGSAVEAQLYECLKYQRLDEFTQILAEQEISPAVKQLQALAKLNGGVEALEQAKETLGRAAPAVVTAINELSKLIASLKNYYPELNIYLDLTNVRGFNYHTGLIFAAYLPGVGQAVAKGGRYNDIGEVYGNARPALGFSADLRLLANLNQQPAPTSKVYAPASLLLTLEGKQLLQELRNQGERLALTSSSAELNAAERRLVEIDGDWQIQTN